AVELLEAKALLRWKESLPNQSSLQTWTLAVNNENLTSPCNWFGISCDNAGSIIGINLASSRIRGNLSNLDFSYFPNLACLNLSSNVLSGPIPSELGLLSKLTHLNLSMNYLSGFLPFSLANLTQISLLYVGNNLISGELDPRLFSDWNRLRFLELHNNNFTGMIPSEIGLLVNLVELALSSNHFHAGFTSKPSFRSLSLHLLVPYHKSVKVQRFSFSLQRSTTLQVPYRRNLSVPASSDVVPLEIGKLSSLEDLDLSENKLNGQIPGQLGECSKLHNLCLRKSYFNGSIPFQLGYLALRGSLDLSQNLLTQQIPSKLAKFTMLEHLNVSHNMLSGSIPSLFGTMTGLTSIDFSYNDLEGPVPDSGFFHRASPAAFSNNKNLCGEVLGLKPCSNTSVEKETHKKNHNVPIIIVSASLSWLILSLALFILYALSRRAKRSRESKEAMVSEARNPLSVVNYDGKIVYEDIIEATESFDEKYCIGSGGSGRVYKAKLTLGPILAIKKLLCLDGEQMEKLRSFTNEIRALPEIRHKNIVKFYGFCCHGPHKFLVYDYIERGSLADVPRDDMKAK
ncbi:hypothetical protein Gotur_016062, partial [Gossypium turneri]